MIISWPADSSRWWLPRWRNPVPLGHVDWRNPERSAVVLGGVTAILFVFYAIYLGSLSDAGYRDRSGLRLGRCSR